jgi:hypothetical protein
MRLRWVVLVLLVPAMAHAQRAAMAPDHRGPNPDVGFEAALSAGTAYSEGIDTAAIFRFEEMMGLALPRRHTGGLLGIALGMEYWRTKPGTWGSAMPVQVIGGLRTYPVPFRFQLGLGVNALLLDRYNGDTGFGLYAPLASASIGLDFQKIAIMADARVTRRWLIGADDHTQWTTTLSVVFNLELAEPIEHGKPMF